MPLIILFLTSVGAAIWWWVRQNPGDAIDTAVDVATTVRNAPRKLAFRKQTNAHPVEGIDDPRIAICAIAQAFIELDDLPTKDQRDSLHIMLRTKLRCTAAEAEEMEVLGRWLQAQCQDTQSAITRLARRLRKIDGEASWDLLQDVLGGLIEGELSTNQVSAIADIKRAFHR
ncbi:hypothetical protein SAMN04488005_3182 [Yoonia tamlensis]|uniref:Tellurite resistance protein TerB n=1 Tax=Yoonia tamlensis TaxID=390270 RepID=A0A1I6I0N2_9RHOB|nr:hypothetical protein [Yoonia tamlensis]SFR60199.1 hypothetical protein SAMN04488005_3182 [Yoonia tamlensis]